MANILSPIFSNAFYGMNVTMFLLKFQREAYPYCLIGYMSSLVWIMDCNQMDRIIRRYASVS